MTYLLWGIGIYVGIGVLTGAALVNTPYGENGAIKNGLCWPLYLFAILTGRF